uniref:Ig-like domain-containing protein n=1 Tax=Gadus morhua TaxID=8049 RepID=A0A8C5C5D3_GADMO
MKVSGQKASYEQWLNNSLSELLHQGGLTFMLSSNLNTPPYQLHWHRRVCVCVCVCVCVSPLRSLHMELSRLSGFEEIKCSARHVYPAPHVTWETDPPASQLLRPITRKLPDKQTGMYEVESRVRRLRHHPEITYICKVTSSYGTQSWTASLRERAEVSGPEGRDLSIPCHAPDDLHDPFLSWTFTQGQDPAHILTYDRQSRSSSVSPLWEGHVQMDTYRVPLGDGSLRLLDPDHQQHTGVYTCVYSAPYRTHTEETEVTISHVGEGKSRARAHTHTHTHRHTHTQTQTHRHTHTTDQVKKPTSKQTLTLTITQTHPHIQANTLACTHTHTHTHTHTRRYALRYTHIHEYTHIYCTYMYYTQMHLNTVSTRFLCFVCEQLINVLPWSRLIGGSLRW